MKKQFIESGVRFEAIKNDVNGSPRYIVAKSHFVDMTNVYEIRNFDKITKMRAESAGARAYRSRNFGGSFFVVKSYNLKETARRIVESRKMQIL